jgi:hypothetical protein
MATIGTILIQAANQATSVTGGGMPTAPGTGGGDATRDLKHQKTVEAQGAQANDAAGKAPKFWTAAFKKMGIQMGLAGILKQSQIFTSTIGSIFQIFGAFVDVILAPFVPMFIPAIRWLARQLPNVAKVAQGTAEGIQKGVKAAWNFLFSGKIWKNIGTWIKDLTTGMWDLIKTGFEHITDAFTDNPFTRIFGFFTGLAGNILSAVTGGLKDWYDNTLAGKRVAMGGEDSILGKIGFTFPGGGAGLAAIQQRNSDSFDRDENEGNFFAAPGTTDHPPEAPGNSGGNNPGNGNGTSQSIAQILIDAAQEKLRQEVSDAKDKTYEFLPDWMVGPEGLNAKGITAASLALVAAGKTANVLTSSLKVGDLRKTVPLFDEFGEVISDMTGVRKGVQGFLDAIQLNPAQWGGKTNPLTWVNTATKPLSFIFDLAAKAVRLSASSALRLIPGLDEGLDFGGDAFRSSTGIQPPGGLARNMPTPAVGQAFFSTLDAGPEAQYRAGSNADVLAKLKGQSPTKLSNAVNAFHKWTQKTGRGLSGAGKSGAAAFTNIFDEGLSLADDVVRIAGKTPGMGFVGQIVSVGFKKVIPGIAGMYMVGETVADLWRMAKSEGDWLGDYKSLDGYTSEIMGTLFAKGSGPGGVPVWAKPLMGMGLLGGPTQLAGNLLSRFGGGSSISDWQENITQAQQDQGVLSAGKAGDMLIRATSGLGGAALQTFFPGLGTLAGTALYEGGRMSTTGIPNPFGEGQLGGNESKYGPAQDFSDLIIQAIKEGFSSGVNQVDFQ